MLLLAAVTVQNTVIIPVILEQEKGLAIYVEASPWLAGLCLVFALSKFEQVFQECLVNGGIYLS